MANTSSFGRIYHIAIYASSVEGSPVMVDFTDHQIKASFRTSNIDTETNSSANVVNIYNVSPTIREAVKTKGAVLVCRAGYRSGGFTDPSTLPVVYKGEIVKTDTQKNLTETVTTLLCSSGYSVKKSATFNRDFPKGTSVASIVTQMAESFSFRVSVDLGTEQSLQISKDMGFSGKTTEILEKFCKVYNLKWYIANDVTYVILKKEPSKVANRVATTIPLDRVKGHLGTTSDFSTVGADEIKTEVSFSMLLYAGLEVGDLINLDIDGKTSTFSIESLTVSLDFYGEDWDTQIIASTKVD